MVSVGTGRVLNFLEGINKKVTPIVCWRLLVQSDVNISYSLESNNGYLNAELLSIQKK